jgi:small subunit ribosomal protein S14
MIRNTSLPQRVRAQAQLQLANMHAYTRPTQITNRCVASGRSKSVFRAFRLTKVYPFLARLGYGVGMLTSV